MMQRKGQTMVEMVVAVGMVALVLVAIVSGVAISVRNSRFSKNKSIATRHAQEALEQLRLLRDEYGWGPFLTELGSGGDYCFDTLPTTITQMKETGSFIGACDSSEVIAGTEFLRDVTIGTSADSITATVVVKWIEGASFHNVTLQTELKNWSN